MSFDDLEQGGRVSLGGGGQYGYQSGMGVPNGMTATSSVQYDQLHNQAVNQVNMIANNVASMQKMVNMLGTRKATQELHERLHVLTERTRELARDTNRVLKQLTMVPAATSAEENQRRVVQRKLGSDLKKQLSTFSALQSRIKSADKRDIDTAKETMAAQAANQVGSAAASDQTQPLLALQLDNEIEFNEQIIQDRATSIEEIEGTIQEVNEIFRDLAALVNEQGDMLGDVETHIENTVVHTEKAAEQLDKANEYHKKARAKAMCLCVTLTLICGGVVVFMTQYAKK